MPSPAHALLAAKRPASSWTPASLSGLYVWWDASDTATITSSGGAVSQFDDKSGNARHLTQSTGTSKPTTGTRTLNGRNVLDFDGGDILSKSGLNVNRPYSGAVVVVPDATTDGRFMEGWNTNPFVGIASSNYVMRSGGGQVATITAAGTSAVMLLFTADATNGVKTYYNGSTGGTSTAGTDGWATFRLMVSINGAFAEGFLTTAEWSAGDIANVRSYLNSKWAVY